MPVKDSGDIGASPIFGLSFGRYITPSLRAEIAIDYNHNVRLTDDDTLSYQTERSALVSPGGIRTNTYAVSRTDTVKLSRTTGLVNLLYDIDTGTRFTPYIGGGVGFSWRQIRRSFSENYTCNATPKFPLGSCAFTPNAALPATSPASGSSTKEQIDFAAAVQAGIGYRINEWITWDNGWQMLWEAGHSIRSPVSLRRKTIAFKDSILQQFRSGIRVKFD